MTEKDPDEKTRNEQSGKSGLNNEFEMCEHHDFVESFDDT